MATSTRLLGAVGHLAACCARSRMSRFVWAAAALVVIAAFAFAARPAAGSDALPDQVNDPETGLSFSCGSWAVPLFQGFAPSRRRLAAVAVRLRAGGLFPAQGATFPLRVRRQSPDGEVVGSAPASVAGPMTGGVRVLARAEFASPLVLEPEGTYVIEGPSVVASVLSWMAVDRDVYPGGTAFDCSGGAMSDSDLNFITFTPPDEAEPNTTILGGPPADSVSSNRDAEITLTGSDDLTYARKLAFVCSLDGQPPADCVSPVSLSALADGRHSFSVRARDEVGRIDQSPATLSWIVETPKPGQGGTLKFNMSATDVDFTDPSLAYGTISWQLEYATALKLFNYPDAPTPAGRMIVPEAAAGFPLISADGKTYTITVKPGFRLSDGRPVTAENFAFAINRALSPVMHSPAAPFITNIAGAQNVIDGKSQTASGVRVDGDKLIIELTQPDGGLLAKLAMPFFQALPTNLALDKNGVNAYPSAGPYYISERTTGRHVTVKRNPYYTGTRPAYADEFDITVNTNLDQSLLQVKSGEVDYDLGGLPATAHADLAQTYGVNAPNGRYHVHQLVETDYIALNTSRPPFSNVNLRKAFNYALDRPAMIAVRGAYAATATDQILPPGMGGFRDVDLYPLDGPDLPTAKSLAGASCGTVKLWANNSISGQNLAQVAKHDLEQIGCTVAISLFQGFQIYTAAGQRGADFDAVLVGWNQDYPDPYDFLDMLLNGNKIHDTNNNNLAYFDDAAINAKLDQANLLVGPDRYEAYGNLDVEIMRDHAPWVPYDNRNEREFTAARLAGYLFQPANASADLNTFYVRSSDTTPPTLVLPLSVWYEATGTAGAAVTYKATATDDVDPSPVVTCTPPSGSMFAIGVTTVTCRATDAAGNSAVGSFTVEVSDRTPPSLAVPAAMSAKATGLAGAAVGYAVTASDVVDPDPAVTCTPRSGSTFAIGVTAVTCTATDTAGNAATGSFTVDVVGGARARHVAIEFVSEFGGASTRWEGDVVTGTVMAMAGDGALDWVCADARYSDPAVTLAMDLRSRHIARLMTASLTATRGNARIQIRETVAPFVLAADGSVKTLTPVRATYYDGVHLVFGSVSLQLTRAD